MSQRYFQKSKIIKKINSLLVNRPTTKNAKNAKKARYKHLRGVTTEQLGEAHHRNVDFETPKKDIANCII